MPAASRNSWLPFVVQAAEVGYIYDGVEYWPIYASKTPVGPIRNVPLNRVLVERLREYVAQHPSASNPNAPFWPGRRRGGHGKSRGALDYSLQFNHGNMYRMHFLPVLAELGIPAVRWHDLRHFYASACAAAGTRLSAPRSTWATPTSRRCTSTICTCSPTATPTTWTAWQLWRAAPRSARSRRSAAEVLTWGARGAAGLIVRDRKRVLLQLRAPWVQYGGTWSIPGGALLPGETAEDAALRETREETALRRRHLHLTERRHVVEPTPGWTYTTVIARLRKSAASSALPRPASRQRGTSGCQSRLSPSGTCTPDSRRAGHRSGHSCARQSGCCSSASATCAVTAGRDRLAQHGRGARYRRRGRLGRHER